MIDVASVALVLVGAICYVWAYAEMSVLRDATHDPKAPIFAGYTRFVRLTQLSWLGLGTITVGVLVGIGAAMHARRVAKHNT
jgi:hypothetical protein